MSKIEWTNKTWNPVTGCTKMSEACRYCYAEVMARRLSGMPASKEKYKNGFKLTLHPECLEEPLKWKKPCMVFVVSMGDLFHKDVPFEFIDKVLKTIGECPQHTFQLLTKRTANMHDFFTHGRVVPDNCWIGTTVESGEYAHRVEILSDIPARVKFLSIEPLVGEMCWLNLSGIDWVIVGGESGNQARPMEKFWVIDIKTQCSIQGVPFFFKQWGTYGEDGIKRNKKANGCSIDGKTYQAWPKAWKGETK